MNTEGWGKDDDLLGDKEIRDLCILKNAGLSCGSVDDLIDEWQDLVNFSTTYLDTTTLGHKSV